MFASLNLTSFFFLFFFVVWGFESRRNREPSQTALNLTSWRIMGNGWGDDVSFLVSETRSLKFCWLFSRLIDYHLVYKMTDNWEKCPSQFSMSSKWRLQTASSAQLTVKNANAKNDTKKRKNTNEKNAKWKPRRSSPNLNRVLASINTKDWQRKATNPKIQEVGTANVWLFRLKSDWKLVETVGKSFNFNLEINELHFYAKLRSGVFLLNLNLWCNLLNIVLLSKYCSWKLIFVPSIVAA